MLKTFIGNEDIKKTLESVFKSGRFPHAFIIEGEKGSGRHTLARIIAAAAVCKSPNAPCGECRECNLIKNDGHCDVLTYAPDGATFKIDTVRELREQSFVMPIEAKRKINIITDADKMTEQAQNAFLKVLEEPPQFMVFILICESASALLTTVRSRCVTLTVKNPDSATAAEYIKSTNEYCEDDILAALEASHGNIGSALVFLTGTVAESLSAAINFFDAVCKNDRLAALLSVKPFEKDRSGFAAFLSELRRIAQRAALNCANGTGDIDRNTAARFMRCAEDVEIKFRRHIGPPLSISLLTTKMVAEIFSDL